MKFQLVKKSSNQLRTVFHVLDQHENICGSISVDPSEEAALLANWHGDSTPGAGPTSPAAKSRLSTLSEAFLASLRQQKPSNRTAAILRGC